MASGWLKRPVLPEPPHSCNTPPAEREMIGGVWRCECRRVWVMRAVTGYWMGYRHTETPMWHRARWFEKLRWMFARSENAELTDS